MRLGSDRKAAAAASAAARRRACAASRTWPIPKIFVSVDTFYDDNVLYLMSTDGRITGILERISHSRSFLILCPSDHVNQQQQARLLPLNRKTVF